jgi:hypothetical protein
MNTNYTYERKFEEQDSNNINFGIEKIKNTLLRKLIKQMNEEIDNYIKY